MNIELIDETQRYRFEKIQGIGTLNRNLENTLCAFYVHSGRVDLSISSQLGKDDIMLQAGQGFLAGPGSTYTLNSSEDFFAVQSIAPVALGEDIIEIIDDGYKTREVPFLGHKLIDNPKRVDKPWGHELWIAWFKNHHVLKQIGMNAGNKSSLQLHENKLETNYLVEGEADVIDQFPIDTSLSEEEMKAAVKNVNWTDYTERKKLGMYWTSKPGIVHRVIAASDYTAYETSTPELDDVIRLSDVKKRTSGRINEEHRKK